MACGEPGKRIPEQQKQRAMELLKSHHSVSQIAQRLGVSKSAIRQWEKQSAVRPTPPPREGKQTNE